MTEQLVVQCEILSVSSVSSLPSCLTGRDLIWFLALTLEMAVNKSFYCRIEDCKLWLCFERTKSECNMCYA